MVNVFETREITIDKSGFWKADLKRVSDWRKGIAVARYYKNSIKPSWRYFLIDKDYNYLYEKRSLEEDEIEGEQIERVFGGYYIVRDVEIERCRQYPGQDRDTEYEYSTCIKDVIDENGRKLSEEERKEYLTAHPIKLTTEYGDDIVECESSFYRLDTYQFLFSISKSLKPIGFFKGVRCKVGVVSDYRDFYVVVKEKEITIVFDEKQFEFVEKLLGIDIKKEKRLYLRPHNKYIKQDRYRPIAKPAEITDVKEIVPEATVKIQNYSLDISIPYVMDGDVYSVFDENYGINRYKFMPSTCYYLVDNEWRKIEGSTAQKVYEKIFEQKCKRPNFIKDIECIAEEIILDEEEYSMYRFECRPYGYITKDGNFDYNFDVNNIKW
jgi:hypothetical protein